ncbi:helix-turn-helix domain-containing protein [Campylobacter coli]|nr:helix-turn-helix domain-containing protein [Campylobacter coli]
MRYMDQYRQMQQFTSLKEFDRHRSRLYYSVKDKLSKGALAVWNTLAQHSCDVPGVCWLKIDTIAKLADVSRSTVERAIRLFKKLGIIRVEETSRPKQGGDGANVYIFQNLGEGAEMKGRQSTEKPCDSKPEPEETGSETKISKAKTLHINHSNVIIRGVPKALQFYKAIFGDNLKTLWFRIHLALKKLRIQVDKETREEIGRVTFDALKSYKYLPEEQLRKLAYTIAYNQLQQRLERGEIFDESDWYAVLNARPPQEPPATNAELNALGVY